MKKQSKYSELSDEQKFKIVRGSERDRVRRKLWAIRYKGGCCQKCGYDKCIGALDFHHIDPSTKEAGWTLMRKMSRENMVKELDKCILVCSNCHREIHYTQTPEFLQELNKELDENPDGSFGRSKVK
jgi:predicted HNH restriction endonuclease